MNQQVTAKGQTRDNLPHVTTCVCIEQARRTSAQLFNTRTACFSEGRSIPKRGCVSPVPFPKHDRHDILNSVRPPCHEVEPSRVGGIQVEKKTVFSTVVVASFHTAARPNRGLSREREIALAGLRLAKCNMLKNHRLSSRRIMPPCFSKTPGRRVQCACEIHGYHAVRKM